TYRGLPADSDETARARMLLRSGLRQAGRSGDDATSATRDFGLSEGFEASFTTPAIGGPSVHEVFARPGVFYVNVNLQRGPATVLVDYEVTFEVVGDPLPDPT